MSELPFNPKKYERDAHVRAMGRKEFLSEEGDVLPTDEAAADITNDNTTDIAEAGNEPPIMPSPDEELAARAYEQKEKLKNPNFPLRPFGQ